MSTVLLLLKVQNWSGFGAMNSNGTSTRLASRAAAPTRWRIFENSAWSGGASSASGYLPRFGSRQLSLLSFQRMLTQLFSISLIWKPEGSCIFVSSMIRA